MKNNWLIEKINFIWRKKYLELFLFLAMIGTLTMFFFQPKLNDFLIFYTLIAILWYTRETMDLKRNSNKELYYLRVEHKTNLRPYLRLQKGGTRGLILVNEGKGIAVNLKPIYKSGLIKRNFLKVSAMASAPGSITESFVPPNLGAELDPSVTNFIIEITYNDIEKRNYLATFKSNTLFNDGFEIVDQKEIDIRDLR